MLQPLTRSCLVLLLCSLALLARAEPVCPERLSMPDLQPIEQEFLALLEQSYRTLGCNPEIISLPGRRGIQSFNRGLVDGEAFRLPLAEARYTRDFVRSATPLFEITTAVCSRPGSAYSAEVLLGYIRGIVWHEQYVAPFQGEYRRARVFESAEQLFAAYNGGEIDHFLCEGFVYRAWVAERLFEQPPLLSRELSREPAYHYLDQRFAPFMQRFSEQLQRGNPFSLLNGTGPAGSACALPRLSISAGCR